MPTPIPLLLKRAVDDFTAAPLTVALAYSPLDNWAPEYGWDDVETFVLSDGANGVDWQVITPVSGDFSFTTGAVRSTPYEVEFTRDASAVEVLFTHAVVLKPISGPSWELIHWQPAGRSVSVPSGQKVVATIRLGYGNGG